MTKGIVFDISRYCVDDGPGIRTTVYLKGCPLHCIWCHNPESFSPWAETGFDEGKCVGCRACVRACPGHCHEINGEKHYFRRDTCIACGECVKACEFDALTSMGEKMDAGQVMDIVERDRPFFETSGGGVTLSGGEVLFQPEFTKELVAEANKRKISVCIETSGFGKPGDLLDIASCVDLVLFDCKHTNSLLHKQFIGVDNQLILNNLHQLDRAGSNIVLRLPVIPGINDNQSHFSKVGELAETLEHLMYLEVMPYHPLGLSKAALLQKEMPYTSSEISKPETVNRWVEEIQSYTGKKVMGAEG